MKVEDKFHIRQRGDVFTMTNEREVPARDIRVRRLRDGASWAIRGVDRYCMHHIRPTLFAGEYIGLMVPDGCDLAVGDEVEIVPEERTGGAS